MSDMPTKRGRGQRRSRRMKNRSLDSARKMALYRVYSGSGRLKSEYRGSFPGGFPTIAAAIADLTAHYRQVATRAGWWKS